MGVAESLARDTPSRTVKFVYSPAAIDVRRRRLNINWATDTLRRWIAESSKPSSVTGTFVSKHASAMSMRLTTVVIQLDR